MQAFEAFIRTMTASGNRIERQAFARLLPEARTAFYHGFTEIADRAGDDRKVIEADLAVLSCLRLLWQLVPTDLFESKEIDYEKLASTSWERTIGDTATRSCATGLSIVFRRLRQHYRKGFRKTSLDLERVAHRRLLDEQRGRCAVCRYRFDVIQQSILDESSFDFLEDYKRHEREVALRSYHRRPELDHILPFFIGGDGPENWQILCKSCNMGKGAALSWLTRKGWVPPMSPKEAMKLTPSLRYVCIAKESSPPSDAEAGESTWRLFKRDNCGLVTLPNLCARLC
jgi:hypothetical protein